MFLNEGGTGVPLRTENARPYQRSKGYEKQRWRASSTDSEDRERRWWKKGDLRALDHRSASRSPVSSMSTEDKAQ